MEIREGNVEITVPDQSTEGVGEEVFYNPEMELNRDITIGVLRAYQNRESRASTYLDGMAATGIRGVRAANEGWDVTLCDIDDHAISLCRDNLSQNDLSGEVIQRNVNSLLHDNGRVFDVVDIDPFGTPIPFADAAFQNTRDLVCITATDTAPLCGAHFKSGKRKYSAIPRNTEYHPEMGLRILLSALVRTAARYDIALSPILSHVTDHYVRTYVELNQSATAANAVLEELGYIFHCPECLWRDHAQGFIPDSPSVCPHCDSDQILSAGLVWLDTIAETTFLKSVRKRLTSEMTTYNRAIKTLNQISKQLPTPTHYDQHRLYKRWNLPATDMDEFLASIRNEGFQASRTQYGGTTFKTTASISDLESIFK
ncbi:MAG: tRNA (guanine(26)-N(2))-dimethyltransferase [Halobacteriaceae archaeon]